VNTWGKGRDDPDELLLRRVAVGDQAAIQALVARKLPRICALATRMLGDATEAEDVAQEAFLRVWRQAPKWRFGEAKFDTWLHRVSLNLCYDRLRRRREQPTAEPPEQIDPAGGADVEVEIMQTSIQIQAALSELPARQRDAIVMHHYQELSNIDAAAVLGVSVEALESLLSRGRRALRARLQGLQP
jgi:RNA polymerase sigma-70 factor (ECF subfamily)